MMEFIIVFPIYIVLFAAIMAVGDMLVHSIRLPSAERTAAFDIGAASVVGMGWSRVTDTLFQTKEIADDRTRQDELAQVEMLDYSEDTSIEGPWSMTAGVKVCDRYKLLVGGTAGQLAFADWYFSDVTKTSRSGGDFGGLISGGAIEMHSKDRATTYSYITLKRRRSFSDGISWRYNARYASDLVVHGGWEKVRDEKYENGFATGPNKANGNPRSFDPADYTRYEPFLKWSN